MKGLKKKAAALCLISGLSLSVLSPAYAAGSADAQLGLISATSTLTKSNAALYKQNNITFKGTLDANFSLSEESGTATAPGYIKANYTLSETTVPDKSFRLDIDLTSNAGNTNFAKSGTNFQRRISMYVVPNGNGNYDSYVGVAAPDDETEDSLNDGAGSMNGGSGDVPIADDSMTWMHLTLYKKQYGNDRLYRYKLGVDDLIMPNFMSVPITDETESGNLDLDETEGEGKTLAFEGTFSWDDLYEIFEADGNTAKYGDKAQKDSGPSDENGDSNTSLLLSFITPYFKGSSFKTRYFVDKNTNLPSAVSGTITNGKWEYLTSFIEAKANIARGGGVDAKYLNAEVKNVSFSAAYDYSDPGITVPDVAKERAKEVKNSG